MGAANRERIRVKLLAFCGAVLAAFLSIAMPASAAAPAPHSYDPREAFAPFEMPEPVSATRSASGLPGPAYWQNRADYSIHATLDRATKTISGTVEIRYANH